MQHDNMMRGLAVFKPALNSVMTLRLCTVVAGHKGSFLHGPHPALPVKFPQDLLMSNFKHGFLISTMLSEAPLSWTLHIL